MICHSCKKTIENAHIYIEKRSMGPVMKNFAGISFHEECFYSAAGEEYKNCFEEIQYLVDFQYADGTSVKSEWINESGSWSIRTIGT